jgi:uncharacterized protein (TIRG00374 family)
VAGAVLAGALAVWLLGARSPLRGFDWNLAAAAMERLRWPWLLLSLVMAFASYYGRALRWAVFLKPLKPRPSIRNLLSATVIGFAAITLFGRPGELVRPYLIAVKERVPVSSQFAAWLLERIFDLLMALLIFGFALTRAHASGAGWRRSPPWPCWWFWSRYATSPSLCGGALSPACAFSPRRAP